MNAVIFLEPRAHANEALRGILDRISLYLYFDDVVAIRSIYVARARLRCMSLELIIAFVRLPLSMDDLLWMSYQEILSEELLDAICLKI